MGFQNGVLVFDPSVLRRVETVEDVQQFGKLKVELIQHHQQFANSLGLTDKVVEGYTLDSAIRNVGKFDFHQFLILVDGLSVGVLEFQFTVSDIDDARILYLKSIYIREEHRGKGIGSRVIKWLKRLGYRVEQECWYGMPSNGLYRSLGAREIKTRYVLI